jgi:hypothetical protein
METLRLYAGIIDQVAWLDELGLDLARTARFNSHLLPLLPDGARLPEGLCRWCWIASQFSTPNLD